MKNIRLTNDVVFAIREYLKSTGKLSSNLFYILGAQVVKGKILIKINALVVNKKENFNSSTFNVIYASIDKRKLLRLTRKSKRDVDEEWRKAVENFAVSSLVPPEFIR